MDTQKVVLTGGPGTGKTETLKNLIQKGHFCLEEISREVTHEAQKKGISQLFLDDPLLFSKKLFDGRVRQFYRATNCAKQTCFIDRGVPDVSAYMYYRSGCIPEEFLKANQNLRYDLIFIFPFWEEIYVSDNERYESAEEAQKIQLFIEKTYKNLGYPLIEVPKGTVNERAAFILKQTQNALTG